MPKPNTVPGPAWFKHRRDDGKTLRVYLKGWFTPLHGKVLDVVGTKANIGGRWITLTGPKCDVQSVEVL